MQSLKSQIKTFFNFNTRQERGAFVLILLIILAFAVDFFLPVLLKEEAYDYSSDLHEIEKWKASAVEISPQKKKASKKEHVYNAKKEVIRLNPFLFNPNNLSNEKWLAMGMPSRIVKTIHNYEAKGGRFKKKEDLLKIYGFTPELFAQLKDFIQIPKPKIPEKIKVDSNKLRSPKTKKIIRIDINKADSIALLKVPGIGSFYAGQIVAYRNRLGGYLSVDQLKEIYKVDSARLQQWIPYLILKDSTIHQMDLNTANFKTVLKHPYIDYEMTKKIFNLRNKLGRFAGMYQLKNDSILSDSLFQKLEPYLKVD